MLTAFDFLKTINILSMAMLGLCCYVGFSLGVMHGLLIVVASLVQHGLSGAWASLVVAPGL